MSRPEYKLCIDCKHCVRVVRGYMCYGDRSRIDGSIKIKALTEDYRYQLCRNEGIYWEPRDDKKIDLKEDAPLSGE